VVIIFEFFTYLLEHKVRTDLQDREGATPLHHASFHGHTEVAETLLDNGARIEAQDFLGGTPLIVAAFHGKGSH
jgi:ankyrin repeat protein